MRTQVPVLVLSLLLLAAFVAGGAGVHQFATDAFERSRELTAIRTLAAKTLELQLDEETGIRGYAATGDPQFLEPYTKALRRFGPTIVELRDNVARSGVALVGPLIDDAARANATWLIKVAAPVRRSPAGRHALLRYGKVLVDQFREDIAGIDSAARTRSAALADDTRGGIDRVNILVFIAASALLVFMFAYGIQQLRQAAAIEEKERIAEIARREQAELRAAYEVEKRIADTLQEAFTQRPLPKLETLRFSASYVPATEDTKVGGDWYDAMALSDRRVLFAIGDVTGHGIEAAVTMNTARQSLLASALRDSDPASVLERVNADLYSRETRLVTAVAGVADSATFEFTYAVAGHPPPILLEPGREPRMLDCGSLPLGAVAGASYRLHRVQTVPGAVLVLYTDGAVEHSRNVIEGERLLLEAVAESRGSSEADAASSIHRAIFSGRSVGDDVAILTVGFSTDPAAGLVLSADRAGISISGRVEATPAPSPDVPAHGMGPEPRRLAS